MKERSYRLGQYEIILEREGGIRWESHGGFAETRSGRCFIEGNVLFLGPTEEVESGSLKNEFLEYLEQYPSWDKTDYYCPSYTLYACKAADEWRHAKRPWVKKFAKRKQLSGAIDHSHLLPGRAPFDERQVRDGFHSLSEAPEADEKFGGNEPPRDETSKGKSSEGIRALTSRYSSAGVNHVKGTLGRAIGRYRKLVGHNAGGAD
jgi:hypothetical protein